MRIRVRSIVTSVTILALLVWCSPAPVVAGDAGARLEGLLLDIDGRAANGFRVHLIDANGREVADAAANEEGLYSFRGLPSGEYSLGVENTQGQMAPLNGPPIRLGDGELARRDLKLLRADADATNLALGANYGLGIWWAGLTTAAKTWALVGTVLVVFIAANALDSGGGQGISSASTP